MQFKYCKFNLNYFKYEKGIEWNLVSFVYTVCSIYMQQWKLKSIFTQSCSIEKCSLWLCKWRTRDLERRYWKEKFAFIKSHRISVDSYNAFNCTFFRIDFNSNYVPFADYVYLQSSNAFLNVIPSFGVVPFIQAHEWYLILTFFEITFTLSTSVICLDLSLLMLMFVFHCIIYLFEGGDQFPMWRCHVHIDQFRCDVKNKRQRTITNDQQI